MLDAVSCPHGVPAAETDAVVIIARPRPTTRPVRNIDFSAVLSIFMVLLLTIRLFIANDKKVKVVGLM